MHLEAICMHIYAFRDFFTNESVIAKINIRKFIQGVDL